MRHAGRYWVRTRIAEATARITSEFPNVRVIILSAHADEEPVWKALRAGAAGYVLKHADPAEIELALATVVRGESSITPAVAQHIVAEFIRRGGNEASSVELLTARQREILQLLAEGRNTKEIARLLAISPRTVEAHRAGHGATGHSRHHGAGALRHSRRPDPTGRLTGRK